MSSPPDCPFCVSQDVHPITPILTPNSLKGGSPHWTISATRRSASQHRQRDRAPTLHQAVRCQSMSIGFQGIGGVHVRGAPGGHIGRKQRRHAQSARHPNESRWIGGRHPEEQRPNPLAGCQRAG
jgi:hypothetical protein